MFIKNITFEYNKDLTIITINDENLIEYKGMTTKLNNEITFKYLENLFRIIDDWQPNYIDNKTTDNASWKLIITYKDNRKKEFSGKSSFPNNFEALLRLNNELIREVF